MTPILISLSAEEIPKSRKTNQEIAGPWKQYMITGDTAKATSLRHFTLKSDGSLKSAYCEIGPRSHMGFDVAEIHYDYPNIQWKEGNGFTGMVNESQDTIFLEYASPGKATPYLLVRDRGNDALWENVIASYNSEFIYRLPDEAGDGWLCGDLAEARIDEDKLYSFIEWIGRGYYDDLHSMLLVIDGKLVLEEYFGDNGKLRGPSMREVLRNKIHHLGSTTKSVTSLLIGIAIDNGFIKSVDVPIFDLLPDYAHLRTPEKNRILLRHFLTMTAGFQWEQFKYEWSDTLNDGGEMWRCEDVIEYTLSKPVIAEPGEKFKYSNGVSTLLGVILKNSTGMGADIFAEKYVFDHLGIEEYEWTSYPDGSIETDGGLALRARDLAKIGQLFLNNGMWNGKRIVSGEWIEESTREHIKLRDTYGGYGYKWQQTDLKLRDTTVFSYCMPGYGGNMLFVIPDLQMILVFNGANYDWNVKRVYVRIIEEQIFPALLMN
jgi:CubicO group peptidase (beta-lactamase class C family)